MSQDPTSPSDSPSSTAASASVSVVDAPERHRFEISVDGTFAGFTEYVDGTGDHAGERTFPHTVIEEAFGGRGLSTLLIRTALDAARVADLAVLPQCSAVAGFIAKHDDYADLVPAERRAEFGL
jgi:predicted GNAT family acetyltransferase